MIHVRLDQFEGPLGLLLYLIRKDEMDIYNIPINKITTQYLEYLKQMRELDLEVAGEFVAMAATLILIKSKMLLPQYDENGELLEAVDDPRKELVQRLIEYQMYQEASKQLNERPLLGRDVWARGLREELPMEEGDIIVDEGGLFALISVYRKVMKQVHKNVHNVRAKGQSIAARILEIKDRLIPGMRITLRELISPLELSSNKILITFLSMLELTKMGFTTLFQSETYGDIYIDTKRLVERNVIDRVEEYDRRAEDLEAVAAGLEADAGGRNLQEIGENFGEDGANDSNDNNVVVNTGEQLGLDTFAPPEQVASDDDILAAEAEMGLAEGAVDLDRVDQILANFSLEATSREAKELAQDIDALAASEMTEMQPVAPASTNLAAISADDFEMAWASFEETLPEQTIAEPAIAEPTISEPAIAAPAAAEPVADSTPAEEPLTTILKAIAEESSKDRLVESQTPKQKVSSLVESAKASLSLFEDETEDFVIESKPEIGT